MLTQNEMIVLIGIASVITGFLVVIITVHYQRKTMHFNTMMHVFERLQRKENRDARKYVRKEWIKLQANHTKDSKEKLQIQITELFDNETFKTNAEKVLRDFNEIGILIYKDLNIEDILFERERVLRNKERSTKVKTKTIGGGYLERKVFFNAYGISVINAWLSLISFSRLQQNHYAFFDALFYDAKKYQNKKYPNKTSRLNSPEMDEDKFWDFNYYILNKKIK